MVRVALITTLDDFRLHAAGPALLGLCVDLVLPLIAERAPGGQLGRDTMFANDLGLVAGPLTLGATGLLVDSVGLTAFAWAIVAAWAVMALIDHGQRELKVPATPASSQARALTAATTLLNRVAIASSVSRGQSDSRSVAAARGEFADRVPVPDRGVESADRVNDTTPVREVIWKPGRVIEGLG